MLGIVADLKRRCDLSKDSEDIKFAHSTANGSFLTNSLRISSIDAFETVLEMLSVFVDGSIWSRSKIAGPGFQM